MTLINKSDDKWEDITPEVNSEAEFYEILSKHAVHPWKFDPSSLREGRPLKDMEEWDRTLVDKPVGNKKSIRDKIETYT